MNHNEAEKILRASVKDLSEPLKSAIEFILANFYNPSVADNAKKFLTNLPSMTTKDAQLKYKIDAAYYSLMNDEKTWLGLEDLPHEEWRNVIGYEGLYKVSNLGRVKSFFKGVAKIRKLVLDNLGYFSVNLYRNNQAKVTRIHVLVAKAFIQNLEDKQYVNHIDGNKLNNRVENLEWVTPSENLRHALNLGLKKSGHEHSRAKFTEEQIRYIREVCISGDKNLGFSALARKFNVAETTVERIYNYRRYRNVI